MQLANRLYLSALNRMRIALIASLCFVLSAPAIAAGTAVGTLIENTASISYDLGGTALVAQSNTTSIFVAERINVVTTLQSPQILVAPDDLNRALLFTVTNTGNGDESFSLAVNSVIAGDDFDPTPSAIAIYFDADGSGDFNTGDVAYTPGLNDPNLGADESIDILILNDIPGTVVNGNIGRSELSATAVTGTGVPGTVFAGQGDGGVDAVIGSTEGAASDTGEYLVSDVLVNVVKSQVILDLFGGAEPIPGATLTYTIQVDVASAGIATASVLRDPIPTFTTYVPNSITLNGGALTDTADGDNGELDTSATPAVVVTLGDLTQADGIQTIVFEVTID